MAENKQKIIAEVYFDKAGFGSRKTTLEDRRKKDKNITKEDVEQFFRKNVEVKKKPRGMNSFVAPYNNHTYQIDLFFISKDDLEAKIQGWFGCHRCFKQVCRRSPN